MDRTQGEGVLNRLLNPRQEEGENCILVGGEEKRSLSFEVRTYQEKGDKGEEFLLQHLRGKKQLDQTSKVSGDRWGQEVRGNT